MQTLTHARLCRRPLGGGEPSRRFRDPAQRLRYGSSAASFLASTDGGEGCAERSEDSKARRPLVKTVMPAASTTSAPTAYSSVDPEINSPVNSCFPRLVAEL